jgi:hypothetical protein
MEHHIIVVDMDHNDPVLNTRAVKPTPEELVKMDDCEGFVIIDPLTMQVFIKGEWQAIPTAKIQENNGVITVL